LEFSSTLNRVAASVTRGPCPSEETLVRWASGQCGEAEVASLAAHIDACEACRAGFSAALGALRTNASPARPSLLEASSPVQPGQVLLRKFEVLEVLGGGGMGVVVRARHLQLNQDVALKFIRPEHLHRSDARARFSREARAAAALRSPYVNRVLDLGELEDGTPFMVLELLTGKTLEACVTERGPLPEADVVRWMLQACQGLEAAHAAGIVHRDLKPANLFLRTDGTMVVLDFGVAKSVNPFIEAGLKQTTPPSLVGSPAFMAPEQLSASPDVGPLVDLWAMGCTMQCLLTGSPPFRANDVIDLAWRVRNAAPTPLPPTVSPMLAAVIARCLEKSPADRFPSAVALREALSQCTPSAVSPPVRRPSRWPVVVAGAGALVVLMGALLHREESPAPTAQPTLPAKTVRALEAEAPPAPKTVAAPPPVVGTGPSELALDAGRAAVAVKPGPRPRSTVPRDAGADDDVYGQRL
jgi:eukaryotic-like serine/threonine-protein kinase